MKGGYPMLKIFLLIIWMVVLSACATSHTTPVPSTYSVKVEWTVNPVEENVVKYNIYLNDKLKTVSTANNAIISRLTGNNSISVRAVNKQDLEGPKGASIKVQ